MQKSRDTIYIGLFLALVLLLWTGFSLLPDPKTAQLPSAAHGGYDLTACDFISTVYITAPVWDSWPEGLYEPEELDSAEAPVAGRRLDYTNVQYATHRLWLKLPPGAVYGISLSSADYAMRVYIDGKEVGSVGIPGISREETVPLERDVIYYFTPQGETTQIVVQAANFVHEKGGDAPTLTVGTAENISRTDTIAKLKSGLLFGALITAGLYHLAIFLMNRRQIAALMFSLLCISLALASNQFIALLFPIDNWQVSVRGEYIVFLSAAFMLVLLVNRLFTGALHRWVYRGYLALCGVYSILVLVSDTTFFTRFLFGFQSISVALAVYGLVRLALRLREKKIKNILAFVGVALVILFSVYDILSRNRIPLFGYPPFFGVGEGMVLFVFCYALVLSIEQAEINKRLEAAGKAIIEAEARYSELAGRQTNGYHPPANLSDFNLTKRETEVALLLLNGKIRDEIAALLCISIGTVNSHCSNIYRKTGSGSVAELVRKLQPGEAAKAEKE